MTAAARGLSVRELDVLFLASQGRSNAEIAADLFLAEPTVKTHVRRVLGKLGACSRTHAVALGYDRGLLTPRLARAAAAARPLLESIAKCLRHPAPLPGQCAHCARWEAARKALAELDAILPGGAK